jgi:preprotein translocase subunit SecG
MNTDYDLDRFRAKVREYRLSVRRNQADLANYLNLDYTELSNRLNATKKARLSPENVRAIVRALAEWGAISTRAQAHELLDLVNCPHFDQVDWEARPLSRLIAEPASLSSPANLPEPAAPVDKTETASSIAGPPATADPFFTLAKEPSTAPATVTAPDQSSLPVSKTAQIVGSSAQIQGRRAQRPGLGRVSSLVVALFLVLLIIVLGLLINKNGDSNGKTNSDTTVLSASLENQVSISANTPTPTVPLPPGYPVLSHAGLKFKKADVSQSVLEQQIKSVNKTLPNGILRSDAFITTESATRLKEYYQQEFQKAGWTDITQLGLLVSGFKEIVMQLETLGGFTVIYQKGNLVMAVTCTPPSLVKVTYYTDIKPDERLIGEFYLTVNAPLPTP